MKYKAGDTAWTLVHDGKGWKWFEVEIVSINEKSQMAKVSFKTVAGQMLVELEELHNAPLTR